MSWMATAITAAAVAGGGAGYLGAKSSNKKLKGMDASFAPYSGYRPPHISEKYLRPVESMINETLMRRSQGNDLYPGVADTKMGAFDIEQAQRAETRNADLQNQLSGMGLSRNLAARDALIGRATTEDERERNKYKLAAEIADAEAARQERDINTERLRQQNVFNFGQENTVADFDRSIWQAETGNELARRGLQAQAAQLYQSPTGEAVKGGIGGASLVLGATNPMGATSSTPRMTSPTGSTVNSAMDAEQAARIKALLGKGYTLSAK